MIINPIIKSGGLKPEIIVTARAGATLNLHLQGSAIILQTYTLGALETTHTFVVDESLTAYVITDATNSRDSDAVLVDAVEQYAVEILYRTYLYNEGDECTALTGGWALPTTYIATQKVANQPSGQTTYRQWVYDSNGNSRGTVTKTKNSDNVYLSVVIVAGNISSATMCANNKIDLSNFSSIFIKTESGASDVKFMARTVYPIPMTSLYGWGGNDSDVVKYDWLSASENIWSCSLNGITSQSYIGILIGGYDGSGASHSATIKKIWLE